MRALADDRREWLPELLVLLGLGVVATILSAVKSLDVIAARAFFRGEDVNRWPLARELPWSALYGAAPWITASLVLVGLGALALGLARRRATLRRHGIFLLLSVVLGPGLIVNTIFKDHWNRPRPRDIVEFGGPSHYAPPLVPRGEGGASFPCGHCSVAFLYASGWWVWKRGPPAWARVSLAAGIVSGFALGLGRMAAGGHFLSDVIWSGLIALGIAHALYYYVLRIPSHEPARAALAAALPRETRFQLATAVAATLGGVGILIALFVTPHGESLVARIPLATLPQSPRAFEFVARVANVEVVFIDPPAAEISIDGELHGFGLPMSDLTTRIEFDAAVEPTLRYRVVQDGWFTDLDGSATVRLPVGRLRRLTVRLERGNIRVTDSTRDQAVTAGRLALDLRTGSGRVASPPLPRP
jgi:membrane-associated PAP2 superfamily phosphatase